MRLGAVLICKNEAANIGRCLTSAFQAGVETVLLVDTGSTDATIDIARTFPNVTVYERPFEGFGPTRSEAFRLAYTYGEADWWLALDADMIVEWDEGWEPDPAVDAYMLDMGGEGFTNRLPLLLNGKRQWMSVGMVHEYTCMTNGDLGNRQDTDAIRITQPGVAAWSPEKARWHLALLEQDDTPRSRFYRAKTLDELGDPQARDAWLDQGVTAEERYYAMWRRALLAPDWPTRQVELQAAWEFRPARLEALHSLVEELNSRGMHHSAWVLASAVTPPCADSLFVHRAVWDWGLLFQRQIAAWWVGAPELAAITDRLLSLNLPHHIRSAVERNASLRAA